MSTASVSDFASGTACGDDASRAFSRDPAGTTDADPVAAVSRCVSDIEVADVVALDLEFSGLFLRQEKDRRPLLLQDYFAKCVESVTQFLPLQLGVCCVRQRPAAPAAGRGDGGGRLWELRSHEFGLWPADRRVFAADLESLKFLRKHGFDFNSHFERAHTFVRMPDKAEAAGEKGTAAGSAKKLKPDSVTRVLVALQDSRVPLVLHNGLLDILHLHDKFVGGLLDDFKAFGKAWVDTFPLLFDTRLLAQEGRNKPFTSLGHSLSLEELHRHFTGLAGSSVRFERAGPLAPGGSAHSAGHDATLTAEVFLMEMDIWLRHASATKSGRKRARQTLLAAATGAADAAAEAPAAGAVAGAEGADQQVDEEDAGGWTTVGSGRKRQRGGGTGGGSAAGAQDPEVGLASASLLESHPVCRRFHNRLAIVGAAPNFMDLGPPPGAAAGLPPAGEAGVRVLAAAA